MTVDLTELYLGTDPSYPIFLRAVLEVVLDLKQQESDANQRQVGG